MQYDTFYSDSLCVIRQLNGHVLCKFSYNYQR